MTAPCSLCVRALVLLAFSLPARGGAWVSPSPQSVAARKVPVLRTSGRHFVDAAGRVVILRGINLSGGAKVPPFLPATDLSVLDRLPVLGMNVVRLTFIWEGFEPAPGQYDATYLARLCAIADAAWARGLYVIVDIHQDGFSRFVSRGSGDGFPLWAVSSRATATTPDNGPRCKNWAMLVATDPSMHRSFTDFYADRRGVRTRYLAMLQRIASAFGSNPGVVGYDVINEPWGDERKDVAPLYEDAARAIRAVDPTAIMFLEGHVTTNCGLQTRLPRPTFDNFAYAPHFYKPSTIVRKCWKGRTTTINHAFVQMTAKAAEWNVPLFLGEFGAPADASRAGDYLDCLHDRLDVALASGAQWNYSPHWNERDKDGWNAEDFNILTPEGLTRPNFTDRPYPKATAGIPRGFRFQCGDAPGRGPAVEFAWDHRPDQGETELFVPAGLFPPGSTVAVAGPPGMTCRRDEARQVVICRSPSPGLVRVRMEGPGSVARRLSYR